MEEWKNIDGFDGLYQISNLGRIKSLNYNRTRTEKVLKPCKNQQGYLQVVLSKNGKHKLMRISRLVAQAFIPNDDIYKTQVNHINEIKTDNRVENLEWCTLQYNHNFGSHNERVSKTQRNDINKSKQVNQFDLTGKFIKTFPSLCEVERQLGFSKTNISACCNGKRKTSNGYIWKYIEEIND